jgi:hypothetical protein
MGISLIVPVGSTLITTALTRVGSNMAGKSSAEGGTSSSNNETHNHYYIGNGTNPSNLHNQQLVPYTGSTNENPMMDNAEKYGVIGTIFGIF